MTKPVDVVSGFYDALGRGDAPAVVASLHDQLEWTEAERFPYFSGTWHSPNEVINNLLVPLSRDWNDFTAKPHDFIAEGNRVVALGLYAGTYKATGRSMTAAFAHVWTVQDDRIVRFEMHTDTAKVLEAMT